MVHLAEPGIARIEAQVLGDCNIERVQDVRLVGARIRLQQRLQEDIQYHLMRARVKHSRPVKSATKRRTLELLNVLDVNFRSALRKFLQPVGRRGHTWILKSWNVQLRKYLVLRESCKTNRRDFPLSHFIEAVSALRGRRSMKSKNERSYDRILTYHCGREYLR